MHILISCTAFCKSLDLIEKWNCLVLPENLRAYAGLEKMKTFICTTCLVQPGKGSISGESFAGEEQRFYPRVHRYFVNWCACILITNPTWKCLVVCTVNPSGADDMVDYHLSFYRGSWVGIKISYLKISKFSLRHFRMRRQVSKSASTAASDAVDVMTLKGAWVESIWLCEVVGCWIRHKMSSKTSHTFCHDCSHAHLSTFTLSLVSIDILC